MPENTTYYYWIQAVGNTGESEKAAASEIMTLVEDIPIELRVDAPFPNPFNPYTTIQYELTHNYNVEIAIFDVTGRRITVLRDDMMPAGVHEVTWNGKDTNGISVGNGVYLYRVRAGEFVRHGKMVLVR